MSIEKFIGYGTDLSEEKLIFESLHSKIYRTMCHAIKITEGSLGCPLDTIERSYENYFSCLSNMDGLVKVIKAERRENKFLILMEFLEGYERMPRTFFEGRKNKDVLFFRAQRIIAKMWKRGFVNLDLAPINFMFRGTQVKMIDLDSIIAVSKMENTQNLWFKNRIAEWFDWLNG